jgi:hypothetical protein
VPQEEIAAKVTEIGETNKIFSLRPFGEGCPLPITSSVLVRTSAGMPTAVVRAGTRGCQTAWQDDQPCCYGWPTWV